MLLNQLDWKANATNIRVAILDIETGIAVFSYDAQRDTYDVALYPSSASRSTHWAGLDALSAQCVLFEIEGASCDVG